MARPLLIAAAILCGLSSQAHAQNYRFEAEQGTYGNGALFANAKPGYSGTGYVSFYNNNPNTFVQVSATVPQGLYELWIGYNSEFGFKGYDYQVNQSAGSGGFDGNGNLFGTDRAGLFHLNTPTNTLRVNRGWGWYNVDYFELRPFTPPALLPVSAQLSDPQADTKTQHLMDYLTSTYGQKTLTGHQHEESENPPAAFPSATYLNLSGGLKPALRSSDFMDYSPTRVQNGTNPWNETEQSIAWARKTGGVVSMMWHWNAPANLVNSSEYPWWRGFYTQGTTFGFDSQGNDILLPQLQSRSGAQYDLIVRDIDAIAVQLQKFEDAGVPVIWRPLHEAQGNADGTSGDGAWFWWGAHGPDVLKELWQLMHERLTDHHGLHNLIWEFTSSTKAGHLNWYPGDDVVDMIGMDIYTDPASSMSGEWYDILAEYNGRKLIALSESGTLPNAELMDLYGIDWSYFSLWKDDFLDDFTAQQVQALLNHEDIVTEGELPLLPWSAIDYDRDGEMSAADFVVWRKMNGQSGTNLLADGDLSGQVNASDYTIWRKNFGRAAFEDGESGGESPGVPEPSTGRLGFVFVVVLLFGSRKGAKAQRA